jgi:twitching motility protein PilT
MDYITYLKKLLDIVIQQEASDLDISVGHVPNIRVTGQLVPLSQEKIVLAEDSWGLAFALLSEPLRKKFMEDKEIDFSYQHDTKGRFRTNIFYQRGNISLALRFIPSKIRTMEELSLPPILHDFVNRPQGLVLITGATSQGKSTTLAAMVDEINHTRSVHIITVEDPIEYTYPTDRAIIEQREVGQDTLSFNNALRASFRQNPDVIMVGEMRDLETISTTITAAETGNLVFGTLHTNSASQTIHRIVDVFSSEQQSQIRFQLSSSLLGVVSQRLIHEIPAVIETSAKEGMISFSRAMVDLVRKKEISLKNAMDFALDPAEIRNLLK